MKVLVLATDYPNNEGGVTLMYIHSRNVYYVEKGIDVTVINFAASKQYNYDGIKVITLADYEKANEHYDVLISHAANLRYHYKFLIKHGDKFDRFIFFFHGHEVLKIRDTYPKPFPYVKERGIQKTFIQDLYDAYKFSVWRHYYKKVENKSHYIFVSGWMLKRFEKYIGIRLNAQCVSIIPNSVGEVFQKESYDSGVEKEYDFISLRNNIDGSKYCVDIINQIALDNPQYKFLLIGKGHYFEHFRKAENITWIDHPLKHEEIPEYLNKSRCALMPTRLDAQGVMMCEMATFGIPVMTSNIDICEELSHVLHNLILFDMNEKIDLSKYEGAISEKAIAKKNKNFFTEETVGKEVQLIFQFVEA